MLSLKSGDMLIIRWRDDKIRRNIITLTEVNDDKVTYIDPRAYRGELNWSTIQAWIKNDMVEIIECHQ